MKLSGEAETMRCPWAFPFEGNGNPLGMCPEATLVLRVPMGFPV